MTDRQRVAHALADPEEILREVSTMEEESRRAGILASVERLTNGEDDPVRRRALTKAVREFYQMGDQL